MDEDDRIGPGPECFACRHCGPPPMEACRVLASGKATPTLDAFEYRHTMASDPHALCPQYADSDRVLAARKALDADSPPG